MEYNGHSYYLHKGYWIRDEDRIGNRKTICLHRVIWEENNGPIPEGCIIHHKDHCKTNNDIDNLECMISGNHTILHNLERLKDEKGKILQSKASKKGWKTRKFFEKVCGECNDNFKTQQPHSKWCSHRCSQRNYLKRKYL